MKLSIFLDIISIVWLLVMIITLLIYKKRAENLTERVENLTNKVVSLNNELADYDKQINDFEQRKLMFFYLREYYLDQEKYLHVASCDRTIYQIDNVLKNLKENNVTEKL